MLTGRVAGVEVRNINGTTGTGQRIRIRGAADGKGVIEIPFHGTEDFERLFARIAGREAADVVGCFDAQGHGAVVNASRSILFAYRTSPYAARYGAAGYGAAARAATPVPVDHRRPATPTHVEHAPRVASGPADRAASYSRSFRSR